MAVSAPCFVNDLRDVSFQQFKLRASGKKVPRLTNLLNIAVQMGWRWEKS